RDCGKRTTSKLLTEALIGRGNSTMDEAVQALRDYQLELERVFTETRDAAGKPAQAGSLVRPPLAPEAREPAGHEDVATATTEENIKLIIDTQQNFPAGFAPHPRLLPQIQRRATMVAQDAID